MRQLRPRLRYRLLRRASALHGQPQPITARTRYQHDAQGALQAIGLPSGHWLHHQRNGQGQVVGSTLSPVQRPWLRPLAPEHTIATHLRRDLAGPSHLLAGNGIATDWQRSHDTSLARTVHRRTNAQTNEHPAGRTTTAQAQQRADHAQRLAHNTQDFITLLLGVAPAHAAEPPKAETPAAKPSAQPGALSLPPDPTALLDTRYLWSHQGWLLHTQRQGAALHAPNQGTSATDTERQTQAYNRAGQLVASVRSTGPPERAQQDTQLWRYAWQPRTQQRLLAQQVQGQRPQEELRQGTTTSRFDAQGRLASVQADGQTTALAYNPNGQPEQLNTPQGPRRYTWDALGRLTQVSQGANAEQALARYAYDHRGLRTTKVVNQTTTHTLYSPERQPLAELDAQGHITRQYLWLADMLLAVMDNEQGTVPASGADTADGQALAQEVPLTQDLWALLKSWGQVISSPITGSSWQLTFIHSNPLRAPELATNAQGQPVWAADYAPFSAATVRGFVHTGSRTEQANAFVLNLRLPGQMFDAETGLHYNRQRYYDPATGQYLTPDPLGQPDGPNAYLYAAGNPLTFIDPDGLILFAFDGTNNSNPPPGNDTFSNVYKFYQAYDVSDPTSGNGDKAWYMNGVGRDDTDSGIKTNFSDAADSNTGRARVDYMLGQLDDYINALTFGKDTQVNIDMVGFSRGAAMARDFSNRVDAWIKEDRWKEKTPCVQMRFLGLWDTVAQFGLNGADNGAWQLAIPDSVRNVYQAVAMNENRYLFPGEAIGRGVQRGFVGMHADIGGSYGSGDLSDVALNWIVEQAKGSEVTMKDWRAIEHPEWGVVTDPIVHGKGMDLLNSDFCLRKNNESWASNCTLRKNSSPGGLTTQQIADLGFITYNDSLGKDADGSTPIVGTVNMEEYAKWLKKNYNLTIATGN